MPTKVCIYVPGISSQHSSLVTEEEMALMVSRFWGSIFTDPTLDMEPKEEEKTANTAFGGLISQFADICVPSIEYLAGL